MKRLTAAMLAMASLFGAKSSLTGQHRFDNPAVMVRIERTG